ncbi:MAG: AlbA family DNA-binding domain-containing protein [Prevotella sp.]
MKRYLLSLISQGEHQQQDFKYRVEDAVKLARSVSAFANTDGGRLLIGVRDDGYLAGVRSEEEIYMMHQAAFRYCRPEASIKFDTYHVTPSPPPDGHPSAGRIGGMRTIVVATVPRSDNRPVCALDAEGNRRAYIRVNDENIVASPVHIRIWRDEQSAKGASFTYGEAERQLMEAMKDGQQLTLNQLVKRTRLPRQKCVTLLARLIRYGLATWRLEGHQFLFALS